MVCLNCHINEAIKHPQFGILPCSDCIAKARQSQKDTVKYEFTSNEIREERKADSKSILQPFRKGELSKEYVDQWGADKLAVSPQEIRNAKPVWNSDLNYYKND